MIKITLRILFFFSCSIIFAQEFKVTGTVFDTQGLPLPGTNITIVNTQKGVQTDFDGNYVIAAKKGDQLMFSYLGFFPQLVTVDTKKMIKVVLQENIQDLDQVVIIGYGSSSKKRIATSIGSIKGNEISNIKFPSIQSLFTGQVAGVQVSQISGRVESGIKVRIRGISTIGASQEPLYVLDGVLLINDDESTNNSPINPLIGINPDDIESIDFLKDAAAAAIYGARGTNGVIIITTKKGKTSKPKITLNTSTGLNFTTKKRDFLNAKQYVALYTEAAENSGISIAEIETRFDQLALGRDWRNGAVDTDWQDIAFRESTTSDINFAASGGGHKAQYYMSTSYNKTQGIIIGNELDRYTMRGKVDANMTDRSKAGFNIGLSKVTIDRIANDNSFVTPLQSLAQSPLTPALLEDGTANVDGNSTLYQNFLGEEQTGKFTTNIWRTTANVYGKFYIVNNLKLVSEIGYDSNKQTAERFSGSLTATPSGFGIISNADTERYILTNYLNYSNTFGNFMSLSTTVGGSFEETTRTSQFSSGSQFPSDDLQTIDDAVSTSGGSNKTSYNFLSYFARSRFDFSSKYALTFSIRRDGSSRFGKNSQFGWFPAASAAWTVSNEPFLKNSKFISRLKFRGSWGITGNAGIGNFASQNLYDLTSYNERIGISPVQIGDPELKWEKTKQYDIGVDFGFFNNVISGEFDYYQKTTEDLLFNQPVPGTTGFNSIVRNVGELVNEGFELKLSANIFSKPKFSWSITGVLTKNQNTITALPSGDIIQDVNILREGVSLSSFYLYEYAGVDPANGDALYYTNTNTSNGALNRDVTNDISQANRIVKGNPFPEYQIGLNSAMKFKKFDFAFLLQGEYGASIFDQAGKFTSSNAQFLDNQTTDQLNRWQNPGDITDVPQARLFEENGQANSTRYLEKVDFVRLRNITLGYTVNSKFSDKFYLEKVRFYFSGLNLFTFTKYQGFDPQSTADFNGGSGILSGASFYSAPSAKSYVFGINIEF